MILKSFALCLDKITHQVLICLLINHEFLLLLLGHSSLFHMVGKVVVRFKSFARAAASFGEHVEILGMANGLLLVFAPVLMERV